MGKNYNGTQISQSVTVSEVAGATVEDCRNKIFVYDENGKAILATGGTKPFIGVALIETGINDMFGEVSGKHRHDAFQSRPDPGAARQGRRLPARLPGAGLLHRHYP